jgi:hypothetical protein
VVEVVEHLELILQVEMGDLVEVVEHLDQAHSQDNLADQVIHPLLILHKEIMVDQEQVVLLLVVEVVVLPQLEGPLQHLQEVLEEQVLLMKLQVQMFHTLVVEVEHQQILQLQVEQVEVEQVVYLLILLQLNQDQLIQVVVEVVVMINLVEQVDQVLL